MSRRRGALGVAVLVLVFVIDAAVVMPRAYRLLGGVHDTLTLPDDIRTCGRDYRKDALDRRWSWADITAGTNPGHRPVVVDPGLLTQLLVRCQSEACTAASCDTVVFVRVDWDAYVDYSLQGGP